MPAWRRRSAWRSVWFSGAVRLALAVGLAVLPAAAQEKRSGYDDAGPQVRAMQDDDMANPAFLWVQQGAALWERREAGARSCADCHGAVEGMRGVAARHPAYDAARGRVVTLEQRVNLCRTERQGAAALAPESDALLGVTALVGLQSRGLPVEVDVSGAAGEAASRGEAFFHLRQGQLNLSCAQCHDHLAGQSLAGSRIPQGHANSYPIYRLEWQGMGSLQRRIRNCLTGVRAEPYPYGAPELVALELYLAVRARGLPMESPAVRP
jgi:sulfur-oxidizing protein SoxA